MYENLLRTFGNFEFLNSKVKMGLLDELLEDLERALEESAVLLPCDVNCQIGDFLLDKNFISFLQKALKLDLAFLRNHPETLFQCLWNRLYWHDSPEKKAFEESFESNEKNSQSYDNPIYRWAKYWENRYESPWLKSKKPLDIGLDSPLKKTLHGHQAEIFCVASHPVEPFLVSGGRDNIRIWNQITGECLQVLEGHKYPVKSVCFSKDGKND